MTAMARPSKARLCCVRPDDLVRAVCEVLGVPLSELRAGRRSQRVVMARRTAAWMMRWGLGMSLPEIGRALGVDHSSVRHAILQMEADIEGDPSFATDLEEFVTAAWEKASSRG